jgi:hypothetical protein
MENKTKYNVNTEDVEHFLDGILHGDDEHREWLEEATYNFFIHNLPIGEPRGSGTKDRLYKEIERLREENQLLKEKIK